MRKKKLKIVLPPELPPEISDDEIEVSDEDLQFVNENRDYAGFVSTLDTNSITKHVTRVADVKEDALESLYERRLQKKSLEKANDDDGMQVDPVDALPVKTLDGELYYRTLSKCSNNGFNEDETGGVSDDKGAYQSVVKLTKAERRAKLKKSRKEAKKQVKEIVPNTVDVEQLPRAEVLAEVKEDLTAEEEVQRKKCKLAELGTALLADPEANIKFLKEMLQIAGDKDPDIVKLGLLSLSAVFTDIIDLRIRLPTEKELAMTVSKAEKKKRYYEATLLSAYKAYLQKLISLEKQYTFQHVAVRCICSLLDAKPHFNFRENLLAAVVRNISSPDDAIRKLCCSTIKSLFVNEGKHRGEATVEAVRLIADHVKNHNCHLHPDSIQVFMSLSFDDDIGRSSTSNIENNTNNKKSKRRNFKEPQDNDKKRSKRELLKKTRDEVDAELKSASFTIDKEEKRMMQSETLSAVFETYFRILKHTIQPTVAKSKANGGSVVGAYGAHPLLPSCLKGLGKFSHLIDVDFMGDLMNHLKRLASSSNSNDESPCDNCLTVTERLQCCIVAFNVMRSNLDALNVDLQEFFHHLYNLILEYRPGRDQGEVLAEALKTMLCDGRQHDMQRAAAFIKRLATFSLCFGSAESFAALVTLKHLLQKNIKCRNLLENDTGGGSVSGSIAKYQPYSSDPNLSGALASVLWELSLLSKHYHPTVSALASSISSMSTSHNQVYLSTVSPPEAFADLSLERESFDLKSNVRKLNPKRKRANGFEMSACNGTTSDVATLADEEKLRKKLSEYFAVMRDISENGRLRRELDSTTVSLQLYEKYKQQKKRKHVGSKSKKNKVLVEVQ